MDAAASAEWNYALGHSAQELARLGQQGQVFAAFTRQLFEQAGITLGMSVLDVGSGAGDSSFLAADLVGHQGRVVGVDRGNEAVTCATTRAASAQIKNVEFVQGDPVDMEFSRPFDAVVGRFVLMYYADPVDAVRKLARRLRPGGLMVFQEFDMEYVRSVPEAPTFERAAELMKCTLRASGTRIRLGSDLYSIFLAAGLPGPSLRMDILIGGGGAFPGFEILAGTIESLLPAMERLGIAAAPELRVATLAERMRDEVIAAKGIALSPALVGAWSRTSIEDSCSGT
jgi:ubiquinone/menaquinone biosynthesis C-methylase UbiE